MLSQSGIRGARIVLLVGLSVAWAEPAWAQTFGEIQGSVVDPSDGVIVGARARLSNTATNQERTVQTNEVGSYRFPFLVPGVYNIDVQAAGFQSQSLNGLVIQVGDVAAADFVLELGDVTESLEVTASLPLLQTQDTAVGTVIDNQRIVDLPINGRTFTDFVKLAPNVTAEMSGATNTGGRQGGERINQPISVAGQRQQFNRFTLDGVENTDVNFNTFVIRPSIDALQEFKVQSGIYSAQYGRATSQINATTRSGTNEFHGTVFHFHRNENLDAAEWRLEGEKNPFVRNQLGFTFGGPLIRNRLFFLSNFEALRDRKAFDQQANVATDRMRAGDFGGFGREIYDPATRVYEIDPNGDEIAIAADRFSNDVIPQSRLHPIALQLFEFYPRATRPGDNIVSNYRRDVSRPIDWEQFLQRVDWQEGPNSSWFGRYAVGDEILLSSNAFPFNQNRTETRVHQVMFSNTRVLAPTLVNEFRLGYNRFNNDVVPFFARERDVGSELDIRGLPEAVPASWGAPIINFSHGLAGILTGGFPWVNRNRAFQVLNNLSWVAGRHSWKFGGELRTDHYNHLGANSLTGNFGHDGIATWDPASRQRRLQTGTGFADFLLGQSSSFRRALEPADARFRATSFSLYTEDAWKARPNLTITLGLRYEFTPSWLPSQRGILNLQMFDPGVGPNGLLEGRRTPIFTRSGEGDFYEGLDFRFNDAIPVQAGDEFIGPRLVRNDRNNFAPRLGIAYSPGSRWTIRAGAGLFFTQDTGNPRFDMARNLSGDTTVRSELERPNIPLGDPLRFAVQEFQCTGWDGTCIGKPFVLANAENRKTPYVVQWMFNVQRQLTSSLVLEAGYLGSAGSKLERIRAYNAPVLPTGPDDRSSIEDRQPWPIYDVIQYVDGSVNSNYNAASVKLQQRFDRGLTYLIGYTWGKSIDDGSAIRTNAGDNLFPANNYDLASERALSQFHTEHRVVSSFLYEIPIGPGKPILQKGVASKILGGWQLGSIVTFSTGTSIAPRGLPGGRRPHATGVSPELDNPTPERFWNRSAFDWTNPNLFYTWGNAGRNVLTSPGFRQWDFSLLNETRLSEGHRLQFRFEAFNFTNHPNWLAPSANVRSRAFGRVTSARTMRELQFGLKYLF